MKLVTEIFILVVIISLISGGISAITVLKLTENQNKELSSNELIKSFYDAETATVVSPHHIRKAMDKGDESFILVDLRSGEEYEREHVIGAVSIPAYKTPEESAYGDVERIVNSFKKLEEENPGKEIIIYCYSMPCMTGRKIGKMLSDNDVYVKELGIGWNEWRYFWNLWNHEHEWNITNVSDYVISGKLPGIPPLKVNSTVCPIENEFGC